MAALKAPQLKFDRESLKLYATRTAIFGIGGGFVLGVLAFTYAYFTVSIPDPKAFVNTQSTIIQYADGSEIGRIGAENRQIVKLADIPLQVRRAVLAAEDRNFYNESAVSPTGMARAIFNDLRGGSLQGGSTITQQYAKTAFLNSGQTISRKIKEIVIAMKLQGQMSKDQILENYLNTIYFGRGSYGIQTASQVYFNRTVNQLNVSQAAVLASILNGPGYYDPYYGAANALRLHNRWAYVLDQMEKAKWITARQRANMKFPTLAPHVTAGTLSGPRGYVVSWVEHELANLGFSDQQLQTGGYVIKTTIDKTAEQAAIDAVNKGLPDSTKIPDLRIGLVSIRPGSGEILALYGGKDYLVSQLNGATQAIAQAGSSFKPFTLVAALEAGIPLSSVWNGSSPQVFDDAGKPYPVFNYNQEQYGNISLIKATAESVNTIYVPLGIKAGPDKVLDVARRAGIPANVALMPTPSISLGVASPHVIDLAAAYATFAAQGIYAKPYIIKEVIGNNSGVLYQSSVQAQQVFQPDVMADLTTALQAVTQYGTASQSVAGLGRPSAGKTGTTTNNASAWFNGYTPQMATTVGMFRNDATLSLNGLGGLPSVTGGTFPAKIWALYTKAALAGQPVVQFPPAANIGGTAAQSMIGAVPTLDPSLAITASPAPTRAPVKVKSTPLTIKKK